MKLITILSPLIFTLFLLYLPSHNKTEALYDPLSVPNNKYGIHILETEDIESAAALVNSSNGDWGYVTFVIRKDQIENLSYWQNYFNKLKDSHLIPIVRIATTISSDYWTKPDLEDIQPWTQFLNSLPWYTENRYIIIYNEPNHAKEWGGKINPGEYTKVLKAHYLSLKETSDDFFILPAGLDASAGNTVNTMEFSAFTSEMHKEDREIFTIIDGWNSHSYPNPAFSQHPADEGKGSLSSFKWEVNLLKNLGLRENIPVFISETGWKHNGNNNSNNSLSPENLAYFISYASENIWSDKNIVAITPFLLNYPQEPFMHFSWTDTEKGGFYPFFDSYRSIPKTSGLPKMKGDVLGQNMNPSNESRENSQNGKEGEEKLQKGPNFTSLVALLFDIIRNWQKA